MHVRPAPVAGAVLSAVAPPAPPQAPCRFVRVQLMDRGPASGTRTCPPTQGWVGGRGASDQPQADAVARTACAVHRFLTEPRGAVRPETS